MATTTETWVGKSRPAVDAPGLVTGATEFVTDLRTPDTCYGLVLRSRTPHGRLNAIDAARAREVPGVLAIVTAADVPVNALGPREVDGPVLASDQIRQVGEAIALIAAVDAATAARAADLIELDVTDLPVVDSPQRALDPDAPQLHSTGNVSGRITFASGDVPGALAAADFVIRESVRTPCQEHVAIDTPGGLGTYSDGKFTIWCGSQNPGLHQRKVARSLAVAPEQVRIIANPVGGAFGARNDDPMPVYLALLAQAAGVPVHIHMTREEVMSAGAKRHPFWTDIEIGFSDSGAIAGSSVTALADTGPVITSGPNVMKTSAEMSTGPYAMPVASFDGVVAYTNNSNAGAFRGYGVPQVALAIENAMTMAAARLGLDPIEIRRRNLLTPGGQHALYRHRITSGLNVDATLGMAADHPLWRDREAWAAGASGAWRRGTGVAVAMKGVGMGSGSGDTARARLDVGADGRLLIWAGPNHTGQSIQTTYEQIAADVLGLPISVVEVRVGDTDEVPESGPTAASRSTYAGGGAVRDACEKFLEHCADLGLPLRTDLVGTCKKLVDISEATFAGEFRLPDTDDIGLIPAGDLATYGPHRVYGACTQVVRVEVNVHTGELRVPDVLCVLDCGTAINPAATIGQAEGGILQGLGMAIMEEHRLDQGRLVTTSLENYLIPTIADTPRIETLIAPGTEDTGPFGAKGMSEVVVVPTGPAVAAAILDAVGVLPMELPVTGERLLNLLEEVTCE